MNPLITVASLALLSIITSCSDGVILLPTPQNAQLRFVNVTVDVPRIRVVIDSTTTIAADRGIATNYLEVAAGRPIAFQLGDADSLYGKNKLFYTFGDNGRGILFVRQDRGGATPTIFEIVHDTLLAQNEPASFVRFVHMAKGVDNASLVEAWIDGEQKLFPGRFVPEMPSTTFARVSPGKHSFEVREPRSPNVIARLDNVDLERGRSYVLFLYRNSYDTDSTTLSIF